MIKEAGIYNDISQAYAALDTSKAVGVMGDKRVYDYIIILRAIVSRDFMTAHVYHFKPEFLDKVSSRIINETQNVCRVVYDISTKPPATIELQ
jgi:GMP synthase (glutamine-hydrolysing)